MAALSQQRCFHHATREAVARCLECRRYFCRECVTEHEDRLICASCLKKLTAGSQQRKQRLRLAVQAGQVLAGILVAWLFFYSLGRILLLIPTSFHDGTIWKSADWER